MICHACESRGRCCEGIVLIGGGRAPSAAGSAAGSVATNPMRMQLSSQSHKRIVSYPGGASCRRFASPITRDASTNRGPAETRRSLSRPPHDPSRDQSMSKKPERRVRGIARRHSSLCSGLRWDAVCGRCSPAAERRTAVRPGVSGHQPPIASTMQSASSVRPEPGSLA